MVLHPNARSRGVSESITLAITAAAQALRAAGRDIVSLSAGEPDFPTPKPVAQAGVRAIEQGDTRYTATSGVPELRRAAAGWLKRQIGVDYQPHEVMVTAGAKAALHMALTTIVEPGDRVLLLAPLWVSYPDLVRLAGGEPVVLAPVPEQGFVHQPEQIVEAARRHGARGIVLNFPNNPSGAVPTRAQLHALVEAAVASDLWIVSDEIYAALTYEPHTHHSPAEVAGARARTLVVAGATKSHSFTGWRLAFLAGPGEVVAAAGRIQSQVLGNPCTISQRAALAICETPLPDELQQRLRAFGERRGFLLERINSIRDLALRPPQGAFYALIDARRLCERRGLDDVQLATRLLEEQGLALVPGTAFEVPGFLRLSYAASMRDLTEGVQRLQRFVEGR